MSQIDFAALEQFITAKLHDAEFVARKLATESSAAYINRHMHTVRLFATATATAKNDRAARNAVLEYALKHCKEEGLFMEFGVYQGRSINFISKQMPEDKTIHGFDSFEGLPEKWMFGRDVGHFSTGGKLPAVGKNVQIHKGWFSDTLPVFLAENAESFSFVHVECNLYVSTKQVFDLARDRFKTGTIIVFGEYFNFPGWEHHGFQAFQEFIAATNRTYEYIACAPRHFSVAVRLGEVRDS